VQLQVLLNSFDNTYVFLEKIKLAVDNGSSVSLDPFIRMSVGFCLESIFGTAKNKLAIVFPRRFQVSTWISALCALGTLREKHDLLSLNDINFNPGQMLLLNGCLVEYRGTDMNQKKIIVRCRDGQSQIPFNRIIQLAVIKTERQLDRMEELSYACFSEKRVAPLNEILGISNNKIVKQNQNIMLISKIGEAEKTLDESWINGVRLKDLFLWGKVTTEGDVIPIFPYEIAADPLCVIAADYFRASSYLDNTPDKTKAVIMDGLTGCVNNLQIVDDVILDRDIPVIVMLDLSETELLNHLEVRDFRIWQWNRKNFIPGNYDELYKHSVFYPIRKAWENYYELHTVPETCQFPLLTQAMTIAERCIKLVDKNDQQINDILSRIIQVIIGLSRMIRVPTEMWVSEFKSEVGKLDRQTQQARLWISVELERHLSDILELLNRIDINKFIKKNHKTEKLKQLIDNFTGYDGLAIVVHRESEIEKCRDYWMRILSRKNALKVSFYTVRELFETDLTYSPSEIIVCGWLGREKMNRIMSSCFSSKITVLLYPYELKWFNHWEKWWKKQTNYRVKLSDFPRITDLDENELNTSECEDFTEEAELENDIEEFEIRMNRLIYSQYIRRENDNEASQKAKLVRFSENWFSFCTETHRLLVVTDLIRRGISQSDIPRKPVNQIELGDLVLYRDSDNDIIREIADIALKKEGLYYLRERAALWQKALVKKYEQLNNDVDKLWFLLREYGCTRHISTVRNWLFNGSIIGPGKMSDLRIIADATQDEELSANLNVIEDAISQLRSVHHQASSFLQKKMLSEVREIFDDRNFRNKFNKMITLNLEGLGQIYILEVEEIGDEWLNVGAGWINRLLRQEDNIWLG
jgi:hypothetical protein